jgi:hypothetical protein
LGPSEKIAFLGTFCKEIAFLGTFCKEIAFLGTFCKEIAFLGTMTRPPLFRRPHSAKGGAARKNACAHFVSSFAIFSTL